MLAITPIQSSWQVRILGDELKRVPLSESTNDSSRPGIDPMTTGVGALAEVDTASVANAIQELSERSPNSGFLSGQLKCRFPALSPMCGRALTAEVASPCSDEPHENRYWEMWEQLEGLDSPTVLVLKCAEEDGSRYACFGEVMAALALRLGAVGVVTDAGIRDVEEIEEMKFPCFSRYVVPSRANLIVSKLGIPVTIAGQEVRTGDVLHGDANGIVVVPDDVVDQIPAESARKRLLEDELINLTRTNDFTLAAFKELRSQIPILHTDLPTRPQGPTA